MVITESITVSPDTFKINSVKGVNKGAINIEGNNIIVDFQGAVLQGSNDKKFPNEYYGIGVFVKGENIEIRNLTVRGFRTGIIAEEVDSLKIFNSTIKFNSRSQLIDGEKNPLANPHDKVPILGSGLELSTCNNFIIKNNKIQQNEFGIYLSDCENGKIYNNEITHNSFGGILGYGSSQNKIMHNYLDWNILKGTTIYNISTGISLKYESIDNLIAFNSITHSRKNYLDKNIIYQNDFFPFSEDSIFQNKNMETISPLPDGQKINPKKYKYKGAKYILSNEWGPYNFEYPAIWLREINEDKYTFAIFGPEGNWKIVGGNGFIQSSLQRGSTPATIVATKAATSKEPLSLGLEFIGVEFTDQFGNKNSRGKSYKFSFQSKN